MPDRTVDVSTYIANAIAQRRSNIFVEKIIGIFFSRVDFDRETLSSLQELSGKGRVVYISYQSSGTSLVIFLNLLRRHGMALPKLALDFSPYLMQIVSTAVKRLVKKIMNRYHRIEADYITDYDYIRRTIVDEKSPVVLSLLSRRQFIRRYIDIQKDTLQFLIEVQRSTDEPIYIVPQLMFWNQAPERTTAIAPVRATGDLGLIAAIITTLRSTTPSYQRLMKPLNLKEEIAQSPDLDAKTVARRLRNRLLEIYNNEKRAVLGPVIKSQQEIMESVLYHKNILDTIATLIEKEGTTERKQRRKAYKYFREIAADFSILYIHWFDWSLDFVYRKIFDGIHYDIEDFKKIREASQHGPLILMPSHKSHMDYLILSSIFYRNKLIPPHIVSGSNLAFFPMGPIFRGCGAFFMRRSFKGLTLYAAIFRQYVKTLIKEGYSIEFFIEGGRTRTGKVLFPKMGILKFLMESIDEGYNRDMVIVPASINYDRILEESSYHKELKGKEKKAESTSTFVKSRKLLKRQYGKVYLTFHEPFSFQEFRKKNPDSEDVLVDLGNYVTRRINDIMMVTPFGITSAAMLSSPAKGFTQEALKESVRALWEYCRFAGAPLADGLSPANFDDAINYVIDSYQKDKIVSGIEGSATGDVGIVLEGIYMLHEESRARITFYKNSIIGHILPGAFTAASLLAQSGATVTVENVIAGCREIMELFSEEFVLPETISTDGAFVLPQLEYLARRDALALEGGMVTLKPEKRPLLLLFARLIEDYFESYFIAADAVVQFRNKMSMKDLTLEVRKNGVKLFHLGDVRLPEALSMPNYNNAIQKMEKQGVLRQVQTGRRHPDVEIVDHADAMRMKQTCLRYLASLK